MIKMETLSQPLAENRTADTAATLQHSPTPQPPTPTAPRSADAQRVALQRAHYEALRVWCDLAGEFGIDCYLTVSADGVASLICEGWLADVLGVASE